MSKKDILIKQIENFDNKYFNQDQKRIAINILKNAPENQAQAYADFLFNKRRTGFAFDYSPEIAKGRLITLREDKDRRINVDDKITNDENKLIIGDNFNALKALLITHSMKIDIIYIDPPYNTESAKNDGNNDSYKEGSSAKFIYKDKFGRTGWLNMMKDRLTLAKDLLKDDGVIFVSIDDSEQAYLKVLMDEIFGEENFVGNLIWDRKTSKSNVKILSTQTEFILFYSKNKSRISNNNWERKDVLKVQLLSLLNKTKSLEEKQKILKSFYHKNNVNWNNYRHIDERGVYRTDALSNRFGSGYIYDIKNTITNQKAIMPAQGWLWTKETMESKIIDGLVLFKKDGKVQKKFYLDEYSNFNNLFSIQSSNGSNDLKIFNINKKMDYPKPKELIKQILQFVCNRNATILDFFAGSGTTGQAVMELNKEDNGGRKFILVTNNENNIAHGVTFERLHRIIKGEGSKQEKDFDWLKNNKPYDNVRLRVINIDDNVKISLDEENIDDKIFDDCKNGLKLLDSEYNKKDLNLYYDLAALNPIEEIEE